MIDEKKATATEEAKKEVKVEEDSEKLTDEQMAQVTGGGIVRNRENDLDNAP